VPVRHRARSDEKTPHAPPLQARRRQVNC
jgi:hypothetical protein